MSRITTTTGELVTEILAPRTELLWNHEDNSGTVRFHMIKAVTLDGTAISQEYIGQLEHSFDTLMARVWDVLIPDGEGGTTTVQVPTALVMATIKTVFDTLYVERNTFLLPPSMSESEEPVV